MQFLVWILFVIGCGVAYLAVRYLYERREMPGQGRRLLAGLRWAAVALLLLLLIDPQIPGSAGGGAARRTQVLVDGSVSMLLPAGAGQSRWQRAVAEARSVGGGDAIVFGGDPRAVPLDSLAAVVPSAGSSRLLPALQAAAEAGVRRVVVISDGGIEDAADVARWLPSLDLELELRPTGRGDTTAVERAISEIDAPSWAQAGKPTDVRVGVSATGAAGAPLDVVLTRDGTAVAQTRIASPGPGRITSAVLRFQPAAPEGGGPVRYEVSVRPGDAAPDDDRRVFYVNVSDNPAGAVLLSFKPDWEPRFLTPVLEQALGLPARGYFRTTSGRYYTIGPANTAGREIPEAEIRTSVAQASLVVLHGFGPAAPAWAAELPRTAPHLLVFPAPEAAEIGLPISLPPSAPGDWYPSPELPPSPIAPLLTSASFGTLPPVSSVRPVTSYRGAWAPILAGNGRRSGTAPLLLGGETDGRRWAVALGEGYWRWAFRGDSARDSYRRLWSAVAGWLVQENRVLAGAVRPVQRSFPRGEPIHWVANAASDSMRLQVLSDQGATVMDTVVPSLRADSAATRSLPPGNYRYRATLFGRAGPPATADGPFTVETYSPDFMRAFVSLADLEPKGDAPVGRTTAGAGTPLHGTVWPYLLLIALVCTEWALRRRWGLR